MYFVFNYKNKFILLIYISTIAC